MLEELDIRYKGEERNDFIVFVTMVFLLNPVSKWGISDGVLVLASLILGIYIFIIKKQNLDMIFVWVMIYWLVINLISFSFIKESRFGFEFTKLVGSMLKMFIGYGVMKLAGIRFIPWFYKTVFILAIVSIPFFFIQHLQPSLFFKIPFNAASSVREAAGHWNGVIFNYSTWHLNTNSGFAGEPGTFGYYIGLAMICNLILHQGKLNKYFISLLVIGLTTVSTNFYLTLILFGFFFISFASWGTKIAFGVLSIFFIVFVFQLPFMGDKINMFVEHTVELANTNVVKSERVNRLATLMNHLQDVAHYPFGYGINMAQRTKNVYGWVIDGTNGLSRIAVYYGVFGLLYFLFTYYRLFVLLMKEHPGAVILLLALIMYIGANPMERDYYAMALFWLFFMINSTDVDQMLLKWDEHKL